MGLNADTQIVESNTSRDDASKVKQSALSAFEKNSHRPFNIPYAFFVTTLAPHNLLLKYFCYLSVVFSLYDLMSQENLGKALSPIVTSRISPKFPNVILRSGILIQELYHYKSRLILIILHHVCLPGAPTAAYKNGLL